MAPKKYPVKLTLPSAFLSKLPEFVAPSPSKSRTKKIATEDKKNVSPATSKTSSPAPSEDKAAQPASKINSGPKEMSTSGLTMNPIANGASTLVKNGPPAAKWVKKPAQFKTFTGFKVKYQTWKHKDTRRDSKVDKKPKADKIKVEKKDKEPEIETPIAA